LLTEKGLPKSHKKLKMDLTAENRKRGLPEERNVFVKFSKTFLIWARFRN
jgi:hypothetical protein